MIVRATRERGLGAGRLRDAGASPACRAGRWARDAGVLARLGSLTLALPASAAELDPAFGTAFDPGFGFDAEPGFDLADPGRRPNRPRRSGRSAPSGLSSDFAGVTNPRVNRPRREADRSGRGDPPAGSSAISSPG